MPQIRFNVGVPRAGSAARDAESSPDRFRSLRPQAGSAARQAEEERRRAAADGPTRPAGMTTLRMRGISQQDRSPGTPAAAATSAEPPRSTVVAAAPPKASNPGPAGKPADQTTAASTVSSAAPGVDPTHPSLDSSPLQTAAAKFRSLFRSVLSRATGEN